MPDPETALAPWAAPLVDLLRASHLYLGGLALVVFAVALAAHKGGRLHRRAGKAGLVAITVALTAALGLAMTSDTNLGVRTGILGLGAIECLVFGMRILSWRKAEDVLARDRALTFATGFAGLAALVFGLSSAGSITTAFAGFLALTTTISHRRQQRDPPRGRQRVAAHRAGLHAAGLFTVFVFASLGAFG